MLFTVGANGLDGITGFTGHMAWTTVKANKVVGVRDDYQRLGSLIQDVLNWNEGDLTNLNPNEPLRFLANQALTNGVLKEDVAAILMAFLLEVADTNDDLRSLNASANYLFNQLNILAVNNAWIPMTYPNQNTADANIIGIDDITGMYTNRPVNQLLIECKPGNFRNAVIAHLGGGWKAVRLRQIGGANLGRWADCVETCIRNIVGILRVDPAQGVYLNGNNPADIANPFFAAHTNPRVQSCNYDHTVHEDWAAIVSNVQGITYGKEYYRNQAGQFYRCEINATWQDISKTLVHIAGGNAVAVGAVPAIVNNAMLQEYLNNCCPVNRYCIVVQMPNVPIPAGGNIECFQITVQDNANNNLARFNIKLWTGGAQQHAEVDNVHFF